MSGGCADRILNYINDNRSAFIELLEILVEAESPSRHAESHTRIRAIITAELHALHYKTLRIGGRLTGEHIYARPCGKVRGARAQLMMGHYDTVWPIGTITERPFTVDENVARGPGVFDMKGGIAQMIFALRVIRDLELQPKLTPVVLVNSDEEVGSRDSTRFIRQLARRVDRALVLEPAMGASGILKTARKGIGRFTITVHGKAAHAGLDPESGASAILELSHVIQRLFALNDADRGVTINVGTVNGGIHPNVIAPHSQAVADVRVPTADETERIEKEIHSIEPSTPGVRLVIDGRIGRPPMEETPRNRALWERARSLGGDLGLELHHGRAGGGSDANTISQYTATLDGLGPVGDGAHAEHEFLYIDKTLERTALLAMLLLSPPVDTPASEENS
jgi:glutamate carboxypeptidase